MSDIINQGDVLLVPFPFTDQTNRKNRPAVVVSKNNTKDLIVAKITSVLNNDENCFTINNFCLSFKIERQSEVRTNSILTIEKKLVIKKLGNIRSTEMSLILDKVKSNFNNK